MARYARLTPPTRGRPRLQRRYVLAVGLMLLAAAALLVAQLVYHVAGRAPAAHSPAEFSRASLIPPDPEVPLPPSPSVEHRFASAAVCSDGAPCSAVGRDILARNGSVVDAMVATLLCNGVVNCQSMGLGGGFLMTLYQHSTRTAITLDAREAAPLKLTPDLVDSPETTKFGSLAVGVPGELKGYWEAHLRYGRLPWKEVVQPAVDVCVQGYNMTKHQADALNFRSNNILNDPTLREVFVDPETGRLKRPGSLVKHRMLCVTLRTIAELGGDDLYNGTLARKFADDIQKMGGVLTENDLKTYSVKWRPPVSVKLHSGETVYSVPPPGSGALLGFILNVLDGYHFTNSSVATTESTVTTYHRITEAFKFAFARRTELGDPLFMNVTELVNNLTSRKYAEDVQHRIRDNSTWQDPGKYGAVFFSRDDHGTAHISVIGPDGDAVSVTSTINLYFGASVTSYQTGIILNSGMDDFSLPEFRNYFGVPPSPANTLAPGKRPMSSMCPTIIVNEDGVRLVIGASGGTKITTSTALVIIRHLWFGESIKQAVDGSRFHHQLYPMQIDYEYGILDDVLKGLEAIGHKVQRYRDRGSIVCAIAKQGDTIFANADYRKGGDVYGLD